jgi:hypothetical protein
MIRDACALGATAAVEMDGNVSVIGSLDATFLSGDGSGLTRVNAATAATATTATTAATVAAGGVATSALADGAVTPAKIAFGKMTIVSKSGGNYSDPAAAMSDYMSWCGKSSSANPCLMKIMPGVYTVTSPVVMQSYIDIEGSGEKTTKIAGALSDGSWPPAQATVMGASNAELRLLTVENTGTASYTAAILNSSASPLLFKVTATASGVNGNVDYGIVNNNSSPTMANVTATASGGTGTLNVGVFNYNSSPTMTYVTATASGGAVSYGVESEVAGTVTINNSVITGNSYSIVNFVTTFISNSQLNGATSNTGTLKCAGISDVSYNFHASDCP